MNLHEIRKLFVEHSGRYDLVSTDDSFNDNGADFFIRAGQKLLDNKADISENLVVFPVQTNPEDDHVRISGVRSIEDIYIDVEGSGPKKLQRVFVSDQVSFFPGRGRGLPFSYGILPTRMDGPDIADDKVTTIMLGPSPDKAYWIFVLGKFYSYPLKDNEDFNFWTMNYPHTLVQAALYTMERFYRNTQGMQDHMAAIEEDLQGIDFEEVDKMIGSRSAMADSFNERFMRPRRQLGF